MTQANDAETKETLAKLAQSRAEILDILEPPPQADASGDAAGASGGAGGGGFPRSRTMKLLMSGRGIGTVGAVLGGLVIARPALAFRLLRMLPAGAVARMLLVKAIASWRTGSQKRSQARRRGPAEESPAALRAEDGINPS